MKYTKPPLTYQEQAELLINRGLIAADKSILIQRLQAENIGGMKTYEGFYKL